MHVNRALVTAAPDAFASCQPFIELSANSQYRRQRSMRANKAMLPCCDTDWQSDEQVMQKPGAATCKMPSVPVTADWTLPI